MAKPPGTAKKWGKDWYEERLPAHLKSEIKETEAEMEKRKAVGDADVDAAAEVRSKNRERLNAAYERAHKTAEVQTIKANPIMGGA